MNIKNFTEFINEMRSKNDSGQWIITTDDNSKFMGVDILYVAKSKRAADMMMTKLWNKGTYENMRSQTLKDFEEIYGSLDKFKSDLI